MNGSVNHTAETNAASGLSEIAGVVYINLARRPDRRAEIEAEIASVGLVGERFEAIEGTPGIVGCLKSHLAVLRLVRARRWKNVLVVEDDFAFMADKKELGARLADFFFSEHGYDVLMLGYNAADAGLSPVRGYQGLMRVRKASTASCYLVRGEYAASLIALYEWALPRLERTGEHWTYANDQVWGVLQRRDRWFCLVPRMGVQRSGWSDNSNTYTDYGV
jgi:glycosyl transferase family 25